MVYVPPVIVVYEILSAALLACDIAEAVVGPLSVEGISVGSGDDAVIESVVETDELNGAVEGSADKDRAVIESNTVVGSTEETKSVEIAAEDRSVLDSGILAGSTEDCVTVAEGVVTESSTVVVSNEEAETVEVAAEDRSVVNSGVLVASTEDIVTVAADVMN